MKNKTVIIINGFPRAGKDTLVEDLSKMFLDRELVKVHNYSSVSLVKEVASHVGYTEDEKLKNPEIWRPFLSDLKDILDQHLNACEKSIYDKIDSIEPGDIIFIHVREPHNIASIESYYFDDPTVTTTSLLVSRPSMTNESRENANNHADKLVESYEYDLVFQNPVDDELTYESIVAYEHFKEIFYTTLSDSRKSLMSNI